MLKRTHCRIRFLASFIGSLVAVCPAVQYGLLHTKRLEREKFLALEASSGDFEAEIFLPNFLKTDLLWWIEIFTDKLQRNYIRSGQFSMEIFTDASLTGWGAVCNGTRTHGFWSPSEKQYHINYLELLAVFHALRCFASHMEGSEILLRVDNSTAISYVNRMGSVKFPTLSDLAREIWCWCSRRNIFIYASYIPSAQNFEADAESRIVSEETEWSLGEQYFDEIEAALGPFEIDLFASSINNKCRDFISWHPDPLAQAVDAFSMSWNQFYFYAFPPFLLILKALRKIITDRAEGVVVEDPSSLEENFPGGRKIIRQAFRLKGTPPAALETTLASISEATVAQYTKPIREWWHFCRQKQIGCFTTPVPLFLEFLSSTLSEIGSYSTLNTYRSAISLISLNEVGSHPLVKRFCKGVAVLKPQRPRYDFVWDPSPVLDHLASLHPYESLSLEILSKKLATLFALTTAQRMQTLAAIQLSNITLTDSLIIKIPARLKTSGIGRSQPLLFFKPFLDKPELCIFSLVKFYLNVTTNLRPQNCDSFFISFRTPYNPVSSQTLGRWVKSELDAAGVDTSIFSAHSTRHAATSLAASKGISLEEIRRTAGWTKSSEVFARFYNRTIIKDSSFQDAILNK
ncbi:uncharacterized protein LOC105203938 [Solenopsis invicta]|uniref:uncharacterized protein LOC105203938 n=1 Tax=Solenopsis invicta TaxID=13686 RepID=UPI00193D041D|nr:uncharacterized protein LOC105203938 [Solenopsis invicta]